MAAACWAIFFEDPLASINDVFLSFTATLKLGLCLGPVSDINLYVGNILNFFKEYSWSLVLGSIITIFYPLYVYPSFLE